MLNKTITRLGLMGALAAVLQISAGILPGIGHLLSMFSTAPMIIVSRRGWREAILAYYTTGMIILLFQPAEVPIFLFTNGLFGVVLGLSLNNNSILLSIFISSSFLTVGIQIISFVFSIPILGGIVNYSIIIRLIFSFFISFIYSLLWVLGIRKYIARIKNNN